MIRRINMKLDLKKPCKHCPFRKEQRRIVRPSRAKDLVEAVESGADFICHKTLDKEEGSVCAGSLAILDKQGDILVNRTARMAERFGEFDPGSLHDDAYSSTFDDFEQFIEAQERD